MRSACQSAVTVLLGLIVIARPVEASFHAMSISEIGAGFGGDPDVQFVELRLDAGGQTQLTDTRLTAFAATGTPTQLLLSNHGVGNGTPGANVLYATAAFTAATGITPDFVIPADLVSPTGMICWGAPGSSTPDPDSWDFDKPNNYVDCVAYGAFAAPTRAKSNTPSALGPGDGTRSLTRTKGSSASGSNDVDFALAAPTVCNNAGECTDLAGGAELCGDADGSGDLAVTDGVQTLRAAANLTNPCTLARCDVDGSGTITVADGVQVLRGAAGLPINGTCEPAGQ